MTQILPPSPHSFSLQSPRPRLCDTEPPPKDWPHAPVHRLRDQAVYMITAGTFRKQPLFVTEQSLDLLERALLKLAAQSNWQLEAWAVLANHYHFVARGAPNSAPMREFLRELHSRTAQDLNKIDSAPGRRVWDNFWDTRLTYQHAYLARLKYVHCNPVHHNLVAVANQYRWCSAAWFEKVASAAQVKTIYRFAIDRVKVPDDF